MAQTVSEEMLGLMNTKDRKHGKLQAPTDSANTAISSSDEVKQLKDQLYEMQMEIDLLKATIDVLKKGPGVNLERLKNSEKTVVIDAVRAKYALSDLLQRCRFRGAVTIFVGQRNEKEINIRTPKSKSGIYSPKIEEYTAIEGSSRQWRGSALAFRRKSSGDLAPIRAILSAIQIKQ